MISSWKVRVGFKSCNYVLCLWLWHRIFSFDWLPWSKPAVAIMPPLLKTKEGPNIAKTAQFQNKPPSVWNQKASLYVQIYYSFFVKIYCHPWRETSSKYGQKCTISIHPSFQITIFSTPNSGTHHDNFICCNAFTRVNL